MCTVSGFKEQLTNVSVSIAMAFFSMATLLFFSYAANFLTVANFLAAACLCAANLFSVAAFFKAKAFLMAATFSS